MMYKDIQDRLRRERDSGKTQKEISDRTGVARSYICKILNGKPEDLGSLSLEVLLRLFPGARIIFDDSRQIGDVKNNTNSPVIQGDGNTVGLSAGEETASEFLRRIMESSDIDAETKVKLYNMLKR